MFTCSGALLNTSGNCNSPNPFLMKSGSETFKFMLTLHYSKSEWQMIYCNSTYISRKKIGKFWCIMFYFSVFYSKLTLILKICNVVLYLNYPKPCLQLTFLIALGGILAKKISIEPSFPGHPNKFSSDSFAHFPHFQQFHLSFPETFQWEFP